MPRLRLFFFGAGASCTLGAIGFVYQHDWVMWAWPFYSYRMSRIFIASILLAVAVPLFLIGLHREWAAARGGAINLFVTFTIISIYALSGERAEPIQLFGGVTACFAIFQVGVYYSMRKFAFVDQRTTPKPVLYSFAVFAIVLISVGLALLANVENVLPWSVSRDLSVIYGAVFLGAAMYFIHGLLVPVWGNARGQLAGFLAYDLVLIWPFVQLLPVVPDRYQVSLYVYMTVVIYSSFLAAFYLWRGPASAEARDMAHQRVESGPDNALHESQRS